MRHVSPCDPSPGEFRKILAAFVSGSAAKSSGILRKITPTSAEPRDAPIANRSQQKLQVGPPPLRTPHGDRETARLWLRGPSREVGGPQDPGDPRAPFLFLNSLQSLWTGGSTPWFSVYFYFMTHFFYFAYVFLCLSIIYFIV